MGKAPQPVQVKIDPTINMKTPPESQVDTMDAGKFYDYAAELVKLQPPHITDRPMISLMARIGIEVEEGFNMTRSIPP